MQVGKYSLINEEKVDRAINGTIGMDNVIKGGVGSSDEAALLAEYDKLGGAIMKGTDKVKMGSFFDFKNAKPFTNPKVSFIFSVNGKFVEVEDGVELPGEIKAVKVAKEEGTEKKVKKSTK